MTIHRHAIIEGPVEVHPSATVGPLACIRGPVIIGPDTIVHPHATIGEPGEHRSKGPVGAIRIGTGCVIREGVAIQRGTGDHGTTVGDRCYVMHGAHVSHDSVLGDDVTLSPNVVLGGHTRVHRGATVGIGAVCHQFSVIGAWSMTGMSSVVTRDVPPFCLVVGNPARFVRFNAHVFARFGLTAEDFAAGLDGAKHPLIVDALRRFLEDSRGRPVLEIGCVR